MTDPMPPRENDDRDKAPLSTKLESNQGVVPQDDQWENMARRGSYEDDLGFEDDPEILTLSETTKKNSRRKHRSFRTPPEEYDNRHSLNDYRRNSARDRSATAKPKRERVSVVVTRGLPSTTHETLEVELARMRKVNIKLADDISELEAENQRLQNLLDEQDFQIRGVQDHQLKRLEVKGFLHAEDDGVIREKLRTLVNSWKSWAREYAIGSLEQMSKREGSNQREIFQYLKVPKVLATSSRYTSNAGSVILNSALASFISERIIQRPFFHLPGGIEHRTGTEIGLSKDSESEYRKIINGGGDVTLAHEWRSVTLRLFDPPEHDTKLNPKLYRDSAQRKQNYYAHLTATFSHTYQHLYRQDVDLKKRETELHDIVHSAGELFSTLWKQKVFISSFPERHHGRPFQSTSNELELHPAQRFDERDPQVDGRLVQMVVQPAILAFGNEEGKQYNQSKVWAKGVVWLTEE